MRKIYILILTLFVLTPSLAQKTALRLRLEKGEKYKQSTDSKSTITQDINGQTIQMVLSNKGSMVYLVTAVNDEGYEMDVSFESLQISMQLPQGTMVFSSEKNDEQDIFSTILSEMKHKPFQVKMTNSGKISEVKNIENLYESAFNRFSQIPQAQLTQIKAQIEKAYGAEAFKGNIEMLTAIFPEQAVAEGDTWTVNTKLESGMAADMVTTYQFVEQNTDHVLINGQSKIETADKDAYVESNGMPMKYDMAGTMASVTKVDKNTGWIIEANINQEIQGDAHIKDNPQIPGGMTIPMVMQNKMTVSSN